MGPDSNSGTVVAYLDGKPVEVGHPMPEITPDYSAGGVSAAEAEESLAAMTAAMSGMTITMEVAVEGLRGIFLPPGVSSGPTPGADIQAGTGPPIPTHKEKADPQEIRKADPGLVWGGVG